MAIVIMMENIANSNNISIKSRKAIVVTIRIMENAIVGLLNINNKFNNKKLIII